MPTPGLQGVCVMTSPSPRHRAFPPRLIALGLLTLPLLAVAAGRPPGAGGGSGSGSGSGGGGSGSGDGGGEVAANNVSFPLILSENIGPTLPADAPWRFAPITDPQSQCIGEAGTSTGIVDPAVVCYYGRKVTVVSETGEVVFSGQPRIWWLQKRTPNFWKSLVVGRGTSTPLAVSAVDVGDLLESSPSIATRKIRTEFNLLQHVAPTDPALGPYVVQSWTQGVPYPCSIPGSAGATSPSLGCFAAVSMSGAVPGTEQSGSEIQGTDFGPGTTPSPGAQVLVDPATLRPTTPDIGGVQAVVYSRCARLVVQRLIGQPSWNPSTGRWDNAAAPVVDVAAYRDEYKAEINSGGAIVYGYNWNAKSVPTGTYRLTFVLDGNDAQGPACAVPLSTRLQRGSTQLVNVGESNPSQVLYAGEGGLGDEGGLVWVDIKLTTKGGSRRSR